MTNEPPVAFITYTKGAVQFVTSPLWETKFLDWLNGVDSSSGYERETHNRVAVKCCPASVYATPKREATVLRLVDDKQVAE